MFGIGPSEFAVIIIVAILVLGPEQLPKIMRTIGKVTSEFRKVSTDFQRTMNMEAHKEEARENELKAKQVAKKKKKKKPQETTENVATAGDSSMTAQTTVAVQADELAAEAHDAALHSTVSHASTGTIAKQQETVPQPNNQEVVTTAATTEAATTLTDGVTNATVKDIS